MSHILYKIYEGCEEINNRFYLQMPWLYLKKNREQCSSTKFQGTESIRKNSSDFYAWRMAIWKGKYKRLKFLHRKHNLGINLIKTCTISVSWKLQSADENNKKAKYMERHSM